MKKIIALSLSAMFLVGLFAVAKPVSAITLGEVQSQLQFLLEQVKQLQAQNQTANVIDSAAETTAPWCFDFKQNLRKGDTGRQVDHLQTALEKEGLTVRKLEKQNNEFGDSTKSAVIGFQNKYKDEVLTPLGKTSGTGFVGETTRAKLNQLYGCGATTITPTTTIPTTTETMTTTIIPTTTITLDTTTASEPISPITTTITEPIPRPTITSPSLTVISPNGGEKWEVGKTYEVKWKTNNAPNGSFVNLIARQAHIVAEGLPPNQGSYLWTIPDHFQPDPDYKIDAILSTSTAYWSTIASDESDNFFTVLPKTGIPTIHHLSPFEGPIGTRVTLVGFNFDLTNNVVQFGPVAIAGLATSKINTLDFIVPQSGPSSCIDGICTKDLHYIEPGKTYPVKVINKNGESNSVSFTVATTSIPSIIVISPNGGEIIEKGKTYSISWKSINPPSNSAVGLGLYRGKEKIPVSVMIVMGLPPSGSYSWNVDPTSPTGNDFYIQAQFYENIDVGPIIWAEDYSDSPFSIVEAKIPWCYDFNKNLKKGDKGKDVAALQTALEKEGFAISQKEKNNQHFLNSTGAAVIGFQEKYKDEILKPVNERRGTGFVGKTTRVKLNQLYGCGQPKLGALAISVSSAPVAQTIMAGGRATFANYNFDTTASSEDVRFPSIPLKLENTNNGYSGAPNNLTSCQLYDGSTALNTGLNSVDPVGSATSTDIIPTFNFDSPLTVPKGIVKTLGLQCKVSTASPAGSQYQWGIAAAPSIIVTGVTSGVEVMEIVTASDGQIMTVAKNGTLTVSLDTSSPPYKIASAGTSGVTLGKLKLHAANEAINLSTVAIQLTNTASSSTNDLAGISLWDGGTKVGTTEFEPNRRFATSTLTTTVTVPKDGDKVLTVKGDLAQIGTSLPATQGALIAVDYDGDDSTGTRGIGQSSGSTINSSARDDTKSAGVRMFKSFPTFAKLPVPSTTLLGGSGTETMDLYRFSVKADSAGSTGIYKFTAYIATTSAPLSAGATTSITNLKLKAYTDPYFSQPVAGFGEAGTPAGQLNNTISTLPFNRGTTTILMNASTQGTGRDYLQIPAGATYYFQLKGDIAYTNGVTSASVQTRIEGDHTYPRFWQGSTYQVAPAASSTVFVPNHHDFIWSPNATTSSLTTHKDWTNGYYVPGLPADNMDPQTLIK